MGLLFLCHLLLISAFSFAQPALNLGNKKCLGGNCENGVGKVLLPGANNIILEGKFTNGILNGEGKAWHKTAAGREYIAEWGTFAGGYLRSGLVYDEAGKPLSNGAYSYLPNGKRFLKSGSIRLKYRGIEAKLTCADMAVDEASGAILLNGLVEVFEGLVGEEGRQLAQYTSKGKYRDGSAWEWDYENAVMHYLYYNKGVLSDTNVIKTIPGKKFVADFVKYANPGDDLFIYNIESGSFSFNGGERRLMICNTGKGILAFYEKDYASYNVFDYGYRNGKIIRKTEAEINALNNIYKQPVNINPSDKPVSKYNTGTIVECNRNIQSLYNRALYALSYYKAAYQNEKGYAGNRRAYEASRNDIIPDCEKAISKYEGLVPPELLAQLKDIRDALKNNSLGMGILRSIPVLRN